MFYLFYLFYLFCSPACAVQFFFFFFARPSPPGIRTPKPGRSALKPQGGASAGQSRSHGSAWQQAKQARGQAKGKDNGKRIGEGTCGNRGHPKGGQGHKRAESPGRASTRESRWANPSTKGTHKGSTPTPWAGSKHLTGKQGTTKAPTHPTKPTTNKKGVGLWETTLWGGRKRIAVVLS